MHGCMLGAATETRRGCWIPCSLGYRITLGIKLRSSARAANVSQKFIFMPSVGLRGNQMLAL